MDDQELCGLDVAIIGGGPAGLAVALSLLQVQPKLSIKVFEAAPEYTVKGAGVGMSMNGFLALEAIDPLVIHRITEAAVYPAVLFDYSDETGERMPWQFANKPNENLDKLGYAPSIVPWNTIRTTLHSRLPEGVVEFGCKVTDCKGPGLGGHSGDALQNEGQEAQGPLYTISILRTNGPGGSESEVYATSRYVIAADGFFSKVRRTAADGLSPVFEGTVRWLGSVTEAELAAGAIPVPGALDPQRNEDAKNCFHSYKPTSAENPLKVAPYRGLNIYAVEETTDSGLRFVWSLYAPVTALERVGEAFPMPKTSEMRPEEDLDQTSAHQTSRRGARTLERALAASPHLPEDVRAMLAATPPERVMEFGLYTHPKEAYVQGRWVHGRGLLLVGDAAHTMRLGGQGANLSFEDGAVLADMVRRYGLGPKAFSAWEEARVSRIRDMLFSQDRTRQMLLMSAAFEPLWDPLQLAAPGGPLPEEVAREVKEAVASGEAEKAQQAVRTWSRGLARSITQAKLKGRRQYETIEPPPGTWRSFT